MDTLKGARSGDNGVAVIGKLATSRWMESTPWC